MIFQAAFHFEGCQTSQLLVVVSFTFLLLSFFLQHNTEKYYRLNLLVHSSSLVQHSSTPASLCKRTLLSCQTANKLTPSKGRKVKDGCKVVEIRITDGEAEKL